MPIPPPPVVVPTSAPKLLVPPEEDSPPLVAPKTEEESPPLDDCMTAFEWDNTAVDGDTTDEEGGGCYILKGDEGGEQHSEAVATGVPVLQPVKQELLYLAAPVDDELVPTLPAVKWLAAPKRRRAARSDPYTAVD